MREMLLCSMLMVDTVVNCAAPPGGSSAKLLRARVIDCNALRCASSESCRAHREEATATGGARIEQCTTGTCRYTDSHSHSTLPRAHRQSGDLVVLNVELLEQYAVGQRGGHFAEPVVAQAESLQVAQLSDRHGQRMNLVVLEVHVAQLNTLSELCSTHKREHITYDYAIIYAFFTSTSIIIFSSPPSGISSS